MAQLESILADGKYDRRAIAAARVRVSGVVQGVGFRPFVWALATRLGLAGSVANDARGVEIEVEGPSDNIVRFLDALTREAPPLAIIEDVAAELLAPAYRSHFEIVESRGEGERQTLVSPDIATCVDCVREIFDPRDRRYRYPFTNCTNCGPRFTIIRDVPYDRPSTSMVEFAICPDCAREYADPANRRFHAQPICCPACGPTLSLRDRDGKVIAGDPISATAELLRNGKIVAIKGLGGYHLAALAADESAVATLRSRKHREDKPFAIMAANLESVRGLAQTSALEEKMLSGPRCPIVLLRRRIDAELAPSIAPGNSSIGVMLPYTPLHHLLCDEFGAPFVLTSGNVSDEPIAYRDDDAFSRLRDIADGFLTHDRAIHIRADDSVVRVANGRETPIRRARGYTPQPLILPWSVKRPILATGAELKSTFALAKDHYAFVSQHIGDLENFETLRSFSEGIEHFRRLFDIKPKVVACDLHPDYLSTRYARRMNDVEVIDVQHHHAHIASCLADNGEEGPAIGVAFDGLGYGVDGTIWGGEFLIADLARFERLGHLRAVPMPGGTAAIKNPWRMAAAYLDAAYGDAIPALAVVARHRDRWASVVSIARKGVNSPLTSSAGRLFDAVAAIVGVRDSVNYEGQAAIELEQRASTSEMNSYAFSIEQGTEIVVDTIEMVRSIVDDIGRGVSADIVAARFHNTVSRIVAETCDAIRTRCGLKTVALSGGVFQNQLLLARTNAALERKGFRVLTHSRVPANDGGISFGQIAVAAARDRKG
ncbi:MAG TPA: carbamoyltransferase HypF [Candidatus Binataceae bacterium]|nr:carbamoyltransferase HypF [Candidatus Binataceae bacterium]